MRSYLALNDALRRPESRPGEVAKRMHQIVEMRFFGFMEYQEIAECLKISRKTVARDIETALAVLRAEIQGSSSV